MNYINVFFSFPLKYIFFFNEDNSILTIYYITNPPTAGKYPVEISFTYSNALKSH